MKVYKLLACILCLWVCSFSKLVAQTPVQVNEGERFFIGKNLEYFVDTTGKLDVQDFCFTGSKSVMI